MPFLGEVAGLVTALLWSGSSVVFSAAAARVGSVHVNIARLIFASAMLCLVVLGFHLQAPLSGGQWWNLAISGVIGLAIGDSFLFRAYTEMGPRITMLIMSLSPALTAFLAYLALGESLSAQGIAGMAVTLGGIVVVVLEKRGKTGEGRKTVTAAGLLFALGGALGQALNLLFAKAAFSAGPIDGFYATLIRITVALVVLLPTMALSGRWRSPVGTFVRDRKALSLTVIGSILGPFLGITFSLIAIANTSVAIASTLMSMVPILMLPLLHFVLKERLSWRSICGACIAVAGVALLFLR
jgi:drug/metabolite transporter (DMT)-like permease